MTVAKTLKLTHAMTVAVIMTLILILVLMIATIPTAVKTIAVPVTVRNYCSLFKDVLDLTYDCFTECDEDSDECDSEESEEDDDDGRDFLILFNIIQKINYRFDLFVNITNSD